MTAVLVDYNTMARDIWPGADWVRGSGPYATVRGCGDRTTVQLHETIQQGLWALRHDMHPGGTSTCSQRHVLLALDIA